MTDLRVPEQVYRRAGEVVLFSQLGVKIEMDRVSNDDYYEWLDRATGQIGSLVTGAKIVEKENARSSPALNTAVYYDTNDYRILPTGALLRTSCNVITHAFCAFKMTEDKNSVRNDHRFVFSGEEKRVIQTSPTSEAAIRVVKELLRRKDIAHPGTYLEHAFGIRGEELEPAICLEDYRYTFYVWLGGKDALRCSLDRFQVSDLRLPERDRETKPVSEVEIAIYPRIDAETAKSDHVVELIRALSTSLCKEFGVSVTRSIKYQRSARALGLYK